MYKNEYLIVPYGMRSTPSGVKYGTPVSVDGLGEHNQLIMLIAKSSSFPRYSNRGPHLNVNILCPVANVDGYKGFPGAICTSFSLSWNIQPSTSKAHVIDITPWALGRLAFQVNLEDTAGATTTARATYAVTVIGKGYQ